MSQKEVTPEAIDEHLSLLKDALRVREPVWKIFEIEARVTRMRPEVTRRFQIPITATFWDLFVAIDNVFGWAYLLPADFIAYDSYDGDRPIVLSGAALWKTELRKYMMKVYHSALMLAVTRQV